MIFPGGGAGCPSNVSGAMCVLLSNLEMVLQSHHHPLDGLGSVFSQKALRSSVNYVMSIQGSELSALKDRHRGHVRHEG